MKFVRRLLWFIASRLLIFSVITSVLILAFYLAMNTANIYILLSDGMQMYTQVVLTRDGSEELPNYFRDEVLIHDKILETAYTDQSPYVNYRITSFESDVQLKWVWSWPWEDVAQAVMEHRVPTIRGTVLSDKSSLVTDGVIPSTPPSWQGWMYDVSLLRENGRWKIIRMTQTRRLSEPVGEAISGATPTPTG